MHKTWCKNNPTKAEGVNTVQSIRTKPASKSSESDTIKRNNKAVLSEFVSIVEKEEKKCQPVRSETRRSLSNLEKIKALDDLEAGTLMVDVAFKHGVNKSMIS